MNKNRNRKELFSSVKKYLVLSFACFSLLAVAFISNGISALGVNSTATSCIDQDEICTNAEIAQLFPETQVTQENSRGVNFSSSNFGYEGPINVAAEVSENFGVIVHGKYTHSFSEDNAIALAIDAGTEEYRANGTWGHAFNDSQRVKISAEYLAQKADYNFETGTQSEWIGQSAIGLTYQILFSNQFFHALNFNTTYSKAQSKDLDTQKLTVDGIDYDLYRRIAGGTDKSFSVGVDLTPTKTTLLGLELNYDDVKYDTKYNESDDPSNSYEDESGLGATVNIEQLLSDFLKVKVSASDRKPYNDYKAEINWLAKTTSSSQLEFGLTGETTTGGQDTDSDSRFGVSLSYKWGAESFDPNATYYSPVSGVGTRTFSTDSLVGWTSEAAVHMSRVLAVAEQKRVQISYSAPTFNFPSTALEFYLGQDASQNSNGNITQYINMGGAAIQSAVSPDLDALDCGLHVEAGNAPGAKTGASKATYNAVLITGIPTKTFTNKSVGITVTNSTGQSATGTLIFSILTNKPIIENVPAQVYTIGSAVDKNLEGVSSLALDITAVTTDPAFNQSLYGITFTPSADKHYVHVSGTPDAVFATQQVILNVTNSAGETTGPFSLTINAAPPTLTPLTSTQNPLECTQESDCSGNVVSIDNWNGDEPAPNAGLMASDELKNYFQGDLTLHDDSGSNNNNTKNKATNSIVTLSGTIKDNAPAGTVLISKGITVTNANGKLSTADVTLKIDQAVVNVQGHNLTYNFGDASNNAKDLADISGTFNESDINISSINNTLAPYGLVSSYDGANQRIIVQPNPNVTKVTAAPITVNVTVKNTTATPTLTVNAVNPTLIDDSSAPITCTQGQACSGTLVTVSSWGGTAGNIATNDVDVNALASYFDTTKTITKTINGSGLITISGTLLSSAKIGDSTVSNGVTVKNKEGKSSRANVSFNVTSHGDKPIITFAQGTTGNPLIYNFAGTSPNSGNDTIATVDCNGGTKCNVTFSLTDLKTYLGQNVTLNSTFANGKYTIKIASGKGTKTTYNSGSLTTADLKNVITASNSNGETAADIYLQVLAIAPNFTAVPLSCRQSQTCQGNIATITSLGDEGNVATADISSEFKGYFTSAPTIAISGNNVYVNGTLRGNVNSQNFTNGITVTNAEHGSTTKDEQLNVTAISIAPERVSYSYGDQSPSQTFATITGLIAGDTVTIDNANALQNTYGLKTDCTTTLGTCIIVPNPTVLATTQNSSGVVQSVSSVISVNGVAFAQKSSVSISPIAPKVNGSNTETLLANRDFSIDQLVIANIDWGGDNHVNYNNNPNYQNLIDYLSCDGSHNYGTTCISDMNATYDDAKKEVIINHGTVSFDSSITSIPVNNSVIATNTVGPNSSPFNVTFNFISTATPPTLTNNSALPITCAQSATSCTGRLVTVNNWNGTPGGVTTDDVNVSALSGYFDTTKTITKTIDGSGNITITGTILSTAKAGTSNVPNGVTVKNKEGGSASATVYFNISTPNGLTVTSLDATLGQGAIYNSAKSIPIATLDWGAGATANGSTPLVIKNPTDCFDTSGYYPPSLSWTQTSDTEHGNINVYYGKMRSDITSCSLQVTAKNSINVSVDAAITINLESVGNPSFTAVTPNPTVTGSQNFVTTPVNIGTIDWGQNATIWILRASTNNCGIANNTNLLFTPDDSTGQTGTVSLNQGSMNTTLSSCSLQLDVRNSSAHSISPTVTLNVTQPLAITPSNVTFNYNDGSTVSKTFAKITGVTASDTVTISNSDILKNTYGLNVTCTDDSPTSKACTISPNPNVLKTTQDASGVPQPISSIISINGVEHATPAEEPSVTISPSTPKVTGNSTQVLVENRNFANNPLVVANIDWGGDNKVSITDKNPNLDNLINYISCDGSKNYGTTCISGMQAAYDDASKSVRIYGGIVIYDASITSIPVSDAVTATNTVGTNALSVTFNFIDYTPPTVTFSQGSASNNLIYDFGSNTPKTGSNLLATVDFHTGNDCLTNKTCTLTLDASPLQAYLGNAGLYSQYSSTNKNYTITINNAQAIKTTYDATAIPPGVVTKDLQNVIVATNSSGTVKGDMYLKVNAINPTLQNNTSAAITCAEGQTNCVGRLVNIANWGGTAVDVTTSAVNISALSAYFDSASVTKTIDSSGNVIISGTLKSNAPTGNKTVTNGVTVTNLEGKSSLADVAFSVSSAGSLQVSSLGATLGAGTTFLPGVNQSTPIASIDWGNGATAASSSPLVINNASSCFNTSYSVPPSLTWVQSADARHGNIVINGGQMLITACSLQITAKNNLGATTNSSIQINFAGAGKPTVVEVTPHPTVTNNQDFTVTPLKGFATVDWGQNATFSSLETQGGNDCGIENFTIFTFTPDDATGRTGKINLEASSMNTTKSSCSFQLYAWNNASQDYIATITLNVSQPSPQRIANNAMTGHLSEKSR